MPDSSYIGRFAPSPTGPLHRGSLIAALASYLDARSNNGYWLVRMEDLDPPREQAGAQQAIIDCLRAHGLHWDGELLHQSQRGARYDHAIEQLLAAGQAYYCQCSRSDIQQMGGHYDGRCRGQSTPPAGASAIRVKAPSARMGIEDKIQGPFYQQLEQQVGDFVIRRKDGLYAYQLAVVVDDAEQKVTDIVRGADLLDSTPRQLSLQMQLHYSQPSYAHLPLLTNHSGQKLSKQNYATALSSDQIEKNLLEALTQLGQPAPPATEAKPRDGILDWATAHWDLNRVPVSLPPIEDT